MTTFCVAYTKAGVSGPPRILITNQADGVEAALYALRVLQVKLTLAIPKPFSLKQILAIAEDCEISMNVSMLRQEIFCPPPMTKAQIEAAFFASTGKDPVTDRVPDVAIDFAEHLEEQFRYNLLRAIYSKSCAGFEYIGDSEQKAAQPDVSLSELQKEFLAKSTKLVDTVYVAQSVPKQ